MRRFLLGSVVALLSAASAQAATIQITDITGTWANGSKGAITAQNNGTAQATASWGRGVESSYTFIAAKSLSLDTEAHPVPFTFGIFSVVNRPTAANANAIIDMRLDIAADVSMDGGPAQRYNFWFDVDHYETKNDTHFCSFGDANGQGCADAEIIRPDTPTPGFEVGFTTGQTGRFGIEMSTYLVTQENTNTFAFLAAEIDFSQTDTVPTLPLASLPMPAPEPMSLALLASGLAGLTVLRRRRG